MGIGISYKGYDGKTRNAVANGVSDLTRIMGETRRAVEHPSAKVPSVGDLLKSAPDPVDGPLVGIEGNESLEPDGRQRAVGMRGGWRIPVTRTEVNVEPSMEMKCNKVTLVKLQYDLIISEKGYVKGRTVERKVWEKSFFVLAEGKGVSESKYSVRLFFTADQGDPVHPLPTAIAFGSEESLDTFNEETKRFACNYDSYGRPLADPPVKVVAVNEYTGGID